MMLKQGAKIEGLQPEILLALIIANDVYHMHGSRLVMTEGTGGDHMVGSLHYQGLAVDLRTSNINDSDKPVILAELKANLGLEYDVIFEGAGTPNEHYHIEFDPKD